MPVLYKHEWYLSSNRTLKTKSNAFPNIRGPRHILLWGKFNSSPFGQWEIWKYLTVYKKCKMKSSFNHNDSISHRMASQHHIGTHPRFSSRVWGWAVFLSHLCDEYKDEDSSLCRQEEEEALHSSPRQCVILTAWFGHWRQAGTVRSAPHNWLGKDLAGHCPDDLYTSPVHPPPPALSAHPLLGERIQTFVKTI